MPPRLSMRMIRAVLKISSAPLSRRTLATPKFSTWQTSRSSWMSRVASPCRSLVHRDRRFLPTQLISRKASWLTSNCPFANPCPFFEKGQCPAQPGKRDERHYLRFTQVEPQTSQRRRRSREQKKEASNLRSAVEATLRSVKHPFPAAKLPVRGLFRVACMVIGSAAVTNVRHIQRYLETKNQGESTPTTTSGGQNGVPAQAIGAFLVRIWAWCERVVGLPLVTRPVLAC